MLLKNLTIKNFRCFESLDMDLHEQLTVIVGSNGSGKTSIVKGAAIALGTLFHALDNVSGISITKSDVYLKEFSMGNTKDVQPQFPVEIEAVAWIPDQSGNSEKHWKRALNSSNGSMTIKDAKEMISLSGSYQKRLQKGDQSLILPLIAYYGPGRLWNYHREKKTDTFKTNTRTNGYIDSLDGVANIKLMMNWFRKKTIQKYSRQEENMGGVLELDVIYQAMAQCFESVTGYTDVKLQYNLDTNELDVYYTCDAKGRMCIALNQLSDGYKGTISLIADIAYRMAILNPQLEKDVLINTAGVVLIDEIDLHLHPAWQQRILGDLRHIFPKVQFIVTTHAPAVINSIRSENLVILKDYQIFGVNSQVYGNDVKSILNEIMGVTERPPEVAKLFQRFYECLEKKEYDSAEQILDQISQLRDYHDQEVIGCQVKLKLERIRGGQK